MKKYNSKDDTMNEPQLQRVYAYPIYPRDSNFFSDEGFVNIDNGLQNGTHWTCFMIKDNKSNYFDSFVALPDKILLNHLSKHITYQKYIIQDISSNLCGSYCLYFFYLFERMKYYDIILKRYFG